MPAKVKIGKYSTDENICSGLMTPKGRIYSPSMGKGKTGGKKQMKQMKRGY